MHFLVKSVISLLVILLATEIGAKFPSIAGLVGVMPLTGALVLIWLYLENHGNPEVMERFTRGAIWGILPSILFFIVAFYCFKRKFSLGLVLFYSFFSWFIGAFIHQILLK